MVEVESKEFEFTLQVALESSVMLYMQYTVYKMLLLAMI